MASLAALVVALWCLLAVSPAGGTELVLAPGEPLTRGAVAEAVREALAAQARDGELAVDVQVPLAPLPNRAAAPMRIVVADLRYDARTGRYDAQLLATLPSGEASTIKSAGRVQEMVEVPVLARRLERGETIRREDLAWSSFARASVRVDALRDIDDLVGLQAVRRLSGGRVVRAGDVAVPRLVRRGDPLSLVFRRAGLEIAGPGIALDDGRHGEPVRVQNAASGEMRQAIVVGPRRVQVQVGAPGSTP
ncbi:MAG TPA: flagellar basal body P-ring formation chaperone FlgA [Geminicoccaceae bacterium]|nr:flagellar basal body P-ring formation chaperone FlgA [Geminicoccaceae bacterium]